MAEIWHHFSSVVNCKAILENDNPTSLTLAFNNNNDLTNACLLRYKVSESCIVKGTPSHIPWEQREEFINSINPNPVAANIIRNKHHTKTIINDKTPDYPPNTASNSNTQIGQTSLIPKYIHKPSFRKSRPPDIIITNPNNIPLIHNRLKTSSIPSSSSQNKITKAPLQTTITKEDHQKEDTTINTSSNVHDDNIMDTCC
jgi:hypothetical protein